MPLVSHCNSRSQLYRNQQHLLRVLMWAGVQETAAEPPKMVVGWIIIKIKSNQINGIQLRSFSGTAHHFAPCQRPVRRRPAIPRRQRTQRGAPGRVLLRTQQYGGPSLPGRTHTGCTYHPSASPQCATAVIGVQWGATQTPQG